MNLHTYKYIIGISDIKILIYMYKYIIFQWR